MTRDTAERARECLCNYRYGPEQPHELECPKHEYPGEAFFGANNRNIKRAEENHMMECGHPKRFWYATTREKETGLDNGVCAACTVDRQRRGPATVQAEAREHLATWMVEHSFSTGHGDTFEDLLKELDWQVKELRGARLEEAKHMKDIIQLRFDEQKDAGPTEERITLSWVLAHFRGRIAALAQALQTEEREGT